MSGSCRSGPSVTGQIMARVAWSVLDCPIAEGMIVPTANTLLELLKSRPGLCLSARLFGARAAACRPSGVAASSGPFSRPDATRHWRMEAGAEPGTGQALLAIRRRQAIGGRTAWQSGRLRLAQALRRRAHIGGLRRPRMVSAPGELEWEAWLKSRRLWRRDFGFFFFSAASPAGCSAGSATWRP